MRWNWIVALPFLLVPRAAFSLDVYWDDSGWGLSLSESDIQQQLSKRFPISKTSQEIFTIECSSPVVDLSVSTNTVTISIAIKAYLLIEEAGFTGIVKVSGIPFYEPEGGSLFIKNANIDEINIIKLPEKHKKHLEALRGVANEVLTTYFDITPVYTLNPANFKESLVKSFLKAVSVKNRQLVVTASLF